MECVNLLPHPVWIHINKSKTIVIPKNNEGIARVQFHTEYWDTINNVPVHNRFTDRINGLPKLKKGVLYIVSSITQDNMDEDTLGTYNIATPDKSCGAFRMHNGIVEVDKLVRFVR